jgi:hypothetical protein
MIQKELDILIKLLEGKKSDIRWTNKRLAEQTLELEMIENRIALTKQVTTEESEVK